MASLNGQEPTGLDGALATDKSETSKVATAPVMASQDSVPDLAMPTNGEELPNNRESGNKMRQVENPPASFAIKLP